MPTGAMVEYARTQEKKYILECLSKKHPLGMTQKELVSKLKSMLGYKVSVPTVRKRCDELRSENQVHVSVQKAKGGALLWILGPEPPEYGQEMKKREKEVEPPLASDELLSFMINVEGKLSANMLKLEKKMIAVEQLARRNSDYLARSLALLTQVCQELDIKLDTNGKE